MTPYILDQIKFQKNIGTSVLHIPSLVLLCELQ
jgi:hypothetical protein